MTDRGLFLLSFVLAGGLWFHAKTEEVYTLRRPLYLSILDLDTLEYVVLEVEPDTVWVELEDRGKVLLLHAFAPPPVYPLRLSGARLGRNAFSLEPENIRFAADPPAGVRVIPPSILLTVDRIQTRTVEVEVPLRVSEGLVVLSRAVRPSRVRVRGPRTVLNTLDAVVTETLIVADSGARDTVLSLLSPPLTRVDPESVRVSIQAAPPPSTP